MNLRAEQVAREDLVMFINACFACTGQREFYSGASAQNVSIAFLHDYIRGNYRRLYALTLAAGINHFNASQIVLNLLASGKETAAAHRAEENALIGAAVDRLPSQRAWRLWEQARRKGINNRRTRAMARDFLANRSDATYDAVKYRGKVRAIASHAHLKLSGELNRFLFPGKRETVYETALFETFRQAHYRAEAIYDLPYTVAEGLAAKHNIPRETFLARIEPRLTAGERLRLQDTAAGFKRVQIEFDPERVGLTKLALYVLSLSREARLADRERWEMALTRSARKTLRESPLRLGKVAAVLDNSYSSSGSSEKRRRPLGVALGAYYLLREAASEFQVFWTTPTKDALSVVSRGQSDLATPLLDALEWGAESIVIVSDGVENDPPHGAAEVLRVYRKRLDPTHRVSIVQCNPVFDADDYTLHALSSHVPTVGLRDAEDLPTMLGFARFADGEALLSELEAYLEARAAQYAAQQERRR